MVRQCLPAIAILFALSGTSAQAQVYSCSSTGAGNVCRITSATSVTMSSTSTNVTYAWDSAVPSPKTQQINFSCASTAFSFTVKDEVGTAAAYPITVSVAPLVSGTIDTATTPFVLSTNFASVTFQCDGNGNWMVE
jgi:hypothetical protein